MPHVYVEHLIISNIYLLLREYTHKCIIILHCRALSNRFMQHLVCAVLIAFYTGSNEVSEKRFKNNIAASVDFMRFIVLSL